MATTNGLKQIFDEYFKNVLYIDDDIDANIFRILNKNTEEKPEKKISKADILAQEEVDGKKEIKIDLPEEKNQKNNKIKDFLLLAQELFPKHNFTPVIFRNDFKSKEDFEKYETQLGEKISQFPLVIIDWELSISKKYTGIDLLKKTFSDKKHKFFIIYTHEIENAKTKLEKETQKLEEDIFLFNDSIIFVFDKIDGSGFEAILNKVFKYTTNKYGYFPLAFLSLQNQVERNSRGLFKDHSEQFDSLIALQTIFSQDAGGTEKYIKNIIADRLLDENSDLSEIHNKIFNDWWVRNKKLITKEEFIKSGKQRFGKKEYDVYYSRYQELIKKDAIDIYSVSDEDREIFIIIANYSLPINADWSNNYPRFVSLMKFNKYSKDKQNIVKELISSFKKDTAKKMNVANKFFQGDVFYKKEEVDGVVEETFKVLITPGCQLFRTDKILNNLTFIEGKVIKREKDITPSFNSNQKKYGYNYMLSDGNCLVYVRWNFYNTATINMNIKKEVETLKGYSRLYKFRKDYIRQLLSNYSAYINSVGVDDIFGRTVQKDHFELFVDGVQK